MLSWIQNTSNLPQFSLSVWLLYSHEGLPHTCLSSKYLQTHEFTIYKIYINLYKLPPIKGGWRLTSWLRRWIKDDFDQCTCTISCIYSFMRFCTNHYTWINQYLVIWPIGKTSCISQPMFHKLLHSSYKLLTLWHIPLHQGTKSCCNLCACMAFYSPPRSMAINGILPINLCFVTITSSCGQL